MSSRSKIWTVIVGIGVILGIIVATLEIYTFMTTHALPNVGGPINGGAGYGSRTVQQPQSGGPDPIAEGDFLYNPGAVSGPAIVEYWNGQGGANKICGTFELPSDESFNYNAGHWWKYSSAQAMQAQWAEHVALYQQKSDNAGCSIGQRP